MLIGPFRFRLVLTSSLTLSSPPSHSTDEHFSLVIKSYTPEGEIMGLAFSRLWDRMFGKKEMRILMVSKYKRCYAVCLGRGHCFSFFPCEVVLGTALFPFLDLKSEKWVRGPADGPAGYEFVAVTYSIVPCKERSAPQYS